MEPYLVAMCMLDGTAVCQVVQVPGQSRTSGEPYKASAEWEQETTMFQP